MYLKKLEKSIKQIYKKNRFNSFKKGELATILKIKKHGYKNLEDTLNIMRKNNLLSYSKDKTFSLKLDINKNITGVIDATPLAQNRNFVFVITEQFEKDIFISLEDLNGAYDNDLVSVEIKFKHGNMIHGKVIAVEKRNRDEFIGTIQEYHNKKIFKSDNGRIHTEFNVNNDLNSVDGDKVVFKITNWGLAEKSILPSGNVTEILGKSGDPEVEILSVIRYYNLPLEFPEEVLENIKTLDKNIVLTENREDFRNLETFTIDPISAKDFDDAISFVKKDYGWKLYIHIADVSHYVTKGSALFNEAVKRGNSFYFPKKVIPMLPKEISNQLCSLRPFEDKYVITAIFDFDKNYNILRQEITEAVICSDLRLSYEEVDILYENKDSDIPDNFKEILNNLRAFSKFITSKRIKNGYLTFSLPDNNYIFDENGKLEKIIRDVETESHKVIENCMILANEYVAELLSEKTNSTLYRIHDKPEITKLLEMKKLFSYYGINFKMSDNLNILFQNLLSAIPSKELHVVFDGIILRMMKKAKYSTDHIGHFGLALNTYTHFTSPIRRLCDLVIHHQIKKNVLAKNKAVFSFNELKQYAVQASDRELLAVKSEREVDRRSLHTMMKDKIGIEYEAIIVHIINNKIIIELVDMPVKGVIIVKDMDDNPYDYDNIYRKLINNSKNIEYKLGMKINVILDSVTEEIIFKIKKNGGN